MAEDYSQLLGQVDRGRLPRHVAIIMDGNGRWAERRGLPRSSGHRAGAESLRRVTELCRELGVPLLTVFAFSTENWRRSQEEIGFLMGLLVEYLKSEVALMNREGVRLGFLGSREGLPPAVIKALDQALADTAANRELTLNLAINYGGRDELLRAINRLPARRPEDPPLDEAAFSALLDTGGQPDPDLLIRPSGERRISNFLLWQCAYAELVFQDILWPDYGKADLLSAIIEYQGRSRRFGGR